jgi:hypothetical protein
LQQDCFWKIETLPSHEQVDSPATGQPDLVEAIQDGFGPAKDGEDPFDAVVGLFLMLDVLLGYRQDGAPDDEAVRRAGN